ncbi:hypothetical protein MAPG_08178 [Magnaporthiopsis poae ATCC 64411]|uniref:Uncharacterized protein n=1 Tax=Magnaporthiopsis poae (strain ATCC 64411 / 73-15) TaxID=644358 RepID=A0A0C4E6N4_MAGP6|nr:hypothetical protein MAPG_08178 [Magnaporthiopsis poae ATCC 64411]
MSALGHPRAQLDTRFRTASNSLGLETAVPKSQAGSSDPNHPSYRSRLPWVVPGYEKPDIPRASVEGSLVLNGRGDRLRPAPQGRLILAVRVPVAAAPAPTLPALAQQETPDGSFLYASSVGEGRSILNPRQPGAQDVVFPSVLVAIARIQEQPAPELAERSRPSSSTLEETLATQHELVPAQSRGRKRKQSVDDTPSTAQTQERSDNGHPLLRPRSASQRLAAMAPRRLTRLLSGLRRGAS